MDDLLEQLDEALDGGMKFPGKRTVIDAEKFRAIVDDMRMTMPTEIKQAKGIVADRADIITSAKREA
ncbi:MAG: ATPase, partial [Oscillospiraceae bacterium]